MFDVKMSHLVPKKLSIDLLSIDRCERVQEEAVVPRAAAE